MDSEFENRDYNGQDAAPTLYLITFICLAAAIIVVAFRLFSHICLLRRRLDLPGWLIVAATLADIGSCILIHCQIQSGMGKHIEYSRMRPGMLRKSLKFGLAQNCVYQALIGVIKTSILAQLHIFAIPGTQQKVLKWAGGFVVIFTTFTTFAAIFQCVPMHAAWDADNFPKGCWNMMAMNFSTSIINTILDIGIFVAPLPTLVRLRTERKRKVSLVIAYCVGSLAIACSIVRLRSIVHFQGIGDFTYEASMVPVWGAIECNAGVICASLPFLMPIFKRISGSTIENSTTAPHLSFIQMHELQQPAEQRLAWIESSKREPQWREVNAECTEQVVSKDRTWKSEAKPTTMNVRAIQPAEQRFKPITWEAV